MTIDHVEHDFAVQDKGTELKTTKITGINTDNEIVKANSSLDLAPGLENVYDMDACIPNSQADKPIGNGAIALAVINGFGVALKAKANVAYVPH